MTVRASDCSHSVTIVALIITTMMNKGIEAVNESMIANSDAKSFLQAASSYQREDAIIPPPNNNPSL